MKNLLICALAFVAVFVACKKDDSTSYVGTFNLGTYSTANFNTFTYRIAKDSTDTMLIFSGVNDPSSSEMEKKIYLSTTLTKPGVIPFDSLGNSIMLVVGLNEYFSVDSLGAIYVTRYDSLAIEGSFVGYFENQVDSTTRYSASGSFKINRK